MVHGITHIFVKKYMETCLKDLLEMQRTERYNIMCSIDAHENINTSEHYDGIRGGGYPLPSNSATEALDFLRETIDFIGCWLKDLEHNFLERYHVYFSMKNCFRKPQLNFLNHLFQRKKHQSLLNAI